LTEKVELVHNIIEKIYETDSRCETQSDTNSESEDDLI